MSTTISKKYAQRWISGLWVLITALIVSIVVSKMNTDVFSDSAGKSYSLDLWNWCLQFIIPNLTIMFGTLIATELQGGRSIRVSKFLFLLCFITVLLYGLLIVWGLGGEMDRLGPNKGKTTGMVEVMEHLRTLGFVLIAFQSVVNLLLGFFFTKSSTTDNPTPDSSPVIS